ncbi:hypothetical protein RDABS01_023622 [Bienertia sinuspersici]
MASLFLKVRNRLQKILFSIMGFLAAMIVLSQFWALPSCRYISTMLPSEEVSWNLVLNGTIDMTEEVGKNPNKMGKEWDDNELRLDSKRSGGHDFSSNIVLSSMRKSNNVETGLKQLNVLHENDIWYNFEDASTNHSTKFGQISMETKEPLATRLIVSTTISSSQVHKMKEVMEFKSESSVIEKYFRKIRGPTISLSEMKSLLHNEQASTTAARRRWTTARDRQLLSASLQIRNAPVLRNLSGLHPPLYWNVSMFKRSYDLMERLLKIYVYKEGEKPIFHHPKLRGLYAAEGWFMKLIERSKHFIVRNARKAHLYYLPFSSGTLRTALHDKKSASVKDLEHYLADYVNLIKTRYHFWNRTRGADHFFIACHDWGSRITRHHLGSCIRGLCNANIARGFSVGKDVSIPVTCVRSGNDPIRDIGGKPASERDILAFFAGQLHGYLRPLLLQYWENKVPDMKIMGPMQRDVQGKAIYREYMKSSKYCICARGYEVHTPRVVESIFYECIPVIISDNYVPPFFEVLNWEAFAVFVNEKDILNLRNILLSITEERYLEMQYNLRRVQRHFIWHKNPEKYDLFHMMLHSVWYNRLSQMRPA